MPLKVLVLEGDPMVRAWFEAGLKARGHEVLSHTGVREAWRAYVAERPPLLILDWAGYSGAELCDRIRSSGDERRCVVLAAGLSDRPRDLEAALRAGADDYLTKFTDAGSLEARLAVAERRVREIQERTLAEEMARAVPESRYRTLFDATPDVVATLSPAGILTSLNPTFEAVTGWPSAAWVGKHFAPLVHPDDVSTASAAFHRALAGDGPRTAELRILTRTGPLRALQCTATAQAPEGRHEGLLVIGRDLTEDKRAHQNEVTLHAASRALGRAPTIAGSAQGVLRAACVGLGWEAGLLWLPERPDARLRCVGVWCLAGVDPDALAAAEAEAGPAEAARAGRRPTWAHEPRLRDVPSSLRLPLLSGEKVLGVLELRGGKAHPPDVSALRTAEALGREIGALLGRRQAEEALRASEERWTLACQGTSDGLWDWNLRTGEVDYSQRWTAMLGDDERGLKASSREWLGRIHPEDVLRVRAKLAAHIKGLTPQFEDEHRMLHRDGSYRWVLCRGFAVRDARGRARRLTGAQMDVTERRNCDPLTGLPNRTLFKERVGHALARSRREAGVSFALLFVDLDDFKAVNDLLGHLGGDRLLRAAARRLEICLRPGDVVGRLGGDEFGVLLEPIKELGDATRVAARIQSELRATQEAGVEVVPTASIGIALSSPSHQRVEDLLRDADAAMYRAKAAGKARFEVFDGGMRESLRAEQELERELRGAVERKQLFLLYEPVVSLDVGRASGFEAQLRWRHPRRGLLSSTDFVPVAERTGLIVPIGEWALKESCSLLKRWQRVAGSGGLHLTLDVSARQLAARGFSERVEGLLRETGLSPQSLRLEVTEAVILSRPACVGAALGALHRAGVGLSIDDFGSGYSRLADLRELPVHTLKIHPSFVAPLGDGGDTGVVRAALSLAHSLGLNAAAAGVESETQAASLRALRCDEGQGTYFSGPLAPEAVETWLGLARPRGSRDGGAADPRALARSLQ